MLVITASTMLVFSSTFCYLIAAITVYGDVWISSIFVCYECHRFARLQIIQSSAMTKLIGPTAQSRFIYPRHQVTAGSDAASGSAVADGRASPPVSQPTDVLIIQRFLCVA